jgi:RHS repeat-associated protein
MFTGGGTVVARYDYDPYGRSTTVLGTTPTDFNFTGLYRHSKSNVDLATYRAYDPDLGRWLHRDPIGEKGGLNLYAYATNNPTGLVDPLGLDAQTRYLPFGFSFSYHIPGTVHWPGEDVHEKQHRDDWWNDQTMPGWKMEQRAFAAEAEYVRPIIASLEGKKCLTEAERELLEHAKRELKNAEMVAGSEANAKWYWNKYDRQFWESEVK